MKKIIGGMLYYSGLIHLYSFIKKLIGVNEVTILMYHRVGDGNNELDQRVVTTDRKNLDEQMNFIAENCAVISFDELYSYCKDRSKIPNNSILITFDDGYRDNYSIAYPILKKYNLKATIALTTGHLGGKELFWWDRIAYCINNTELDYIDINELGAISLINKVKAIRSLQEKLKTIDNHRKMQIIHEIEKKTGISNPEIDGLFLSWDEVREMCNHNISFAAHTVTHPIMTRLSFSEAKKEIIDSKKEIEYQINKNVNVFVYPNGNKNDMSKEIDDFLKRSGFIFSLSTQYGSNILKKGLFRLRRVHIENNDDMLMFKIKVKGFGRILAPIYGKIKELL